MVERQGKINKQTGTSDQDRSRLLEISDEKRHQDEMRQQTEKTKK
ncbi:hypothetical protein [Bacillus solitudinis]|nr:hypothetical protein [Bacillus solitudinis]